ncbi:GNAT family N-acetyltransferase [Hymenobacter sp. 102]|uniref:GNAT family N-acetyltransferase n=1 Tax=Hymenobacter sp. 102 TaxID=3403152 RepID=UPI003CEDAC1A
MPVTVIHHAQNQEFTIEQEGGSAELAYSKPAAGILDFTHTYVDEALRGRGLAEELARTGLAFAREQGLRVRTSCRFMQKFMDTHPQYQHLREAPADTQ